VAGSYDDNESTGAIKGGDFMTIRTNFRFSRRTVLHGVSCLVLYTIYILRTWSIIQHHTIQIILLTRYLSPNMIINPI
jgi:hypothetical protein